MAYRNKKLQAAANADWYLRNRERKLEQAKEWRDANRLATQLHSLKTRARARGIPFHIKPSDIQIPKHCPILGILLVRNAGHGSDTSPSIDRVNIRRGYYPDNVRVISYRANMMKRDGTLKEWRKLVAYMEAVEAGRK